jgi:YHS domain-containing protein
MGYFSMFNMKRRSFVAGLALLAPGGILISSQAHAGGKINASFFGTVAIEGYDPVAYFTSGKPTKGQSKFSAKWRGASWRFASAKNRDAFKKMPEKYAPQYGGYCAWAVSQGYTAAVDPTAWKVVDNKLYLNYSPGVQATWVEDIPGNIKKANANWPGIEKSL